MLEHITWVGWTFTDHCYNSKLKLTLELQLGQIIIWLKEIKIKTEIVKQTN